MKKRMFSLLLAACLLISLLPCAALAEGNMIVNLGTVRAGSVLDMQMGTTESGTASLTSAGQLLHHYRGKKRPLRALFAWHARRRRQL